MLYLFLKYKLQIMKAKDEKIGIFISEELFDKCEVVKAKEVTEGVTYNKVYTIGDLSQTYIDKNIVPTVVGLGGKVIVDRSNKEDFERIF